MRPESERLIAAFKLQLRMKSPFFATLALFAGYQDRPDLPTAATDGRDIFFNPEFLLGLPPDQAKGVLMHEVLHAALLHVTRRRHREAFLWNVAADIVVNGMIVQEGVFALPEGAILDQEHAHLSVEEIYELLTRNKIQRPQEVLMADLLEPGNSGQAADSVGSSPSRQPLEHHAHLETYWERARQQAANVARTSQRGHIPSGQERELEAVHPARLNWKAHLWRYLVQTPTDFSGFDRRFIGRGLYLEDLAGESLKVHVAVDTSGSIDHDDISKLLGEVQGILGSYPHLQCDLYYADADLYGPYPLTTGDPFPPPQGGGGTSFVPFFKQIETQHSLHGEEVCIYLTDGYGDFPATLPATPVLWVVTAGGLSLDEFPFGEAVRMVS
jgi:predicted metal-dependent peptidase